MCSEPTQDTHQGAPGHTRRRVLEGLAASAAAAATAPLITARASAASTPRPSASKLSVTLLGTNGGPPPISSRYGIASALTVNGKNYVIDCGRGALSQFMRAGLSLPDLSGIFLTHLHADHIVDYFSFLQLAGGAAGTSGFRTQIGAFGPGPSGLESPFPSAPGPAPGLAELTALANRAYMASPTFFRTEGVVTGAGTDPTSWVAVHEITPPASANAGPHNPAPAMTPFVVHEDDNVRVSATLVPHGAVFPAYAYRFDTEHGSVVFSGDTSLTPNMTALAKDADLLVHEVIDAAALADLGLPPALLQHILEVHTDIEDIGAIAQQANVGSVAINHFAPGDTALMSETQWRKRLRQSCRNAGYRGDAIVGSDLLGIPVR